MATLVSTIWETGKITPSLPEVVMGELQSKWQFLTWFFPADT
jgi:hypothetical protein